MWKKAGNGSGERTVKYCPECGAEVKEDDKFCRKCGHGISQEVLNKERKSPEKEIDEELKKLEESVTKRAVDKEPKNVEGKIPAQRGDVSIDVKKGKKKRASKEEKKTKKKPKASTKKKELGASKKEEKPTVWKKSILEKTEKRMMPRTKKKCDILFCYNYHFCFSFSCGRCGWRWVEQPNGDSTRYGDIQLR